jgi:hypothetical protein
MIEIEKELGMIEIGKEMAIDTKEEMILEVRVQKI